MEGGLVGGIGDAVADGVLAVEEGGAVLGGGLEGVADAEAGICGRERDRGIR